MFAWGEKEKGTEYSSQNSYTTTTYSTKVELILYNESGENIFSETKRPLLGSLDFALFFFFRLRLMEVNVLLWEWDDNIIGFEKLIDSDYHITFCC